MSAYNPYFNDSSATLTPPHEDYKTSYDNLVGDDSTKPFTANSNHQTFAVEAPSHRRGTSFPFNKSISSHSDDTSHEPPSNVSYPPLPVKEVETGSAWHRFLPESLACRLYIVTVLIETTIDLSIEGELLLRLRSQAEDDTNQITSRKMPVYLSIFALAHVFQLVMAVDAVHARNTLQFFCLAAFNALFLVYAVIQIGEVREALSTAPQGVGPLTTVIPIVIAICEICYIGLAWKIYHEFGWKVYKFLGADRRIKKMYVNYQVYECLVKFDVFFWVGFSVQFIWLVLQKNDWEYYVTCAALPLSVVLLVEGHLAARHENKWMMATFMSGCIGAMIYFIYKLIKVLILKDTHQFKFVWKTLTVFSIIAIVLLFLTMALSVVILRNFGRGLKDALERKNNPTHNRYASQAHRRAASTNLNRMSIN
ncbi:UPF0658 Golgi apparatus membrane protein [Termitomyces sp. T112]|nr:hypothetical protein C0989_011094 [Termitomyces sp. Mn162]KAG5719336.1 UPF0658 Golgi apparatus membrane protein [Termitomyces sp. T112]KAH0590424.1 hypothetical protein H2248_000578 [Termitomyces sp. 'cryptogamus']KNZ71466.1 UPF0658 Golgi apparatus membrane protein [Termitomyces sp. J132]